MSSLCSLLLLLLLLLFPCSPVSSIYLPPSSPRPGPRGLLFEDKTRLGSMPPSCHNKCNQCHPCMAVQVPTLPGPKAARARARARAHPMAFYNDPSSLTKKYSNYKPLGWKCRCNGHFYNP
ncbi:hypothetical protein AB3S75_004091 [Citrus x aurantiifolia]